jgi:hypothetical protein
MDTELEAWLKDLFGADSPLIAEVGAKLDPVAGKIKEGQLRQSDYSKKMAAIQTKQEELTTADRRLTEELAEWSRLKAEGNVEAETLQRQIEQHQQEKLAMEQALARAARDAGKEAKDYWKPSAATPDTPKPVSPPVVPPNVLTKDEFGAAAAFFLDVPVTLQTIAAEHQALTGQPFNSEQFLAQMREAASSKKSVFGSGKDVRAFWEQTWDIPAKRQAQADAKLAADLKAAEDRGYQRARTEEATPTAHPAGTRAPVFQRTGPDGQAPTPVLKPPVASDRHAKYV